MADQTQTSILPLYAKEATSAGGTHYIPLDLEDVTGGLYAHVQVLGIAGSSVANPVPSEPSAVASTGVTLPPHTAAFQVDTGSWATVLPSSMFSNFDATKYPSGTVTYTSDTLVETGVWAPVVLAFPDARLPDGSVPTTTVTALVSTSNQNVHMMGIGFDVARSLEVDAKTGLPQVTGHIMTAADNALLNLSTMTDGGMAHSYAITGQGIVLGATADPGTGWITHQLQAGDAAAPNGVQSWQLAQVMSSLDGVPRGSFELLLDVGLNKMFYEFEGGSKVVRGDHAITITLDGQYASGISYSFDTAGNSSQEPTTVTIESPQHGGSFINTGVNVLRGFDYLFDADTGTIALRSNGAGHDTVISVVAPLDAASFAELTAGAGADGAVDATSLVHGAIRANLPHLAFDNVATEVHLADGELSLGATTDAAYVTRLYDGLLGREADMPGLWFWNHGLETGASRTDVAAGFLGSDESSSLLADVSDADFVATLYRGLLDRTDAAWENSFWTGVISAGGSRADVLDGIADSAEARSVSASETARIWVADPMAQQVGMAYETALGRLPEADGLRFWVQAMQSGLTNSGFDAGIVQSAEFQALHGQQNHDELATSLYLNGLGRAPDAAELAAVADYSAESLLTMIARSAEASQHFQDIL